jgi:competence protein ComEA
MQLMIGRTARSALLTIFLLCLTITLFAGVASAKVVRIYQGQLNLNTASVAELTRLPGVGETIAVRIVKERERRKLFKQKNELLGVKGISPQGYERLKEIVSVQGDNSLKIYLDVNTISKPVLLGLPGMTNGEARSLIAYRKAHGPFTTLEDILHVPGIDRKRLAELEEWLTVADRTR